jgi:hypothetical protein
LQLAQTLSYNLHARLAGLHLLIDGRPANYAPRPAVAIGAFAVKLASVILFQPHVSTNFQFGGSDTNSVHRFVVGWHADRPWLTKCLRFQPNAPHKAQNLRWDALVDTLSAHPRSGQYDGRNVPKEGVSELPRRAQ